MKTGFAVIGAGFGDEGKGLITDYLARKHTLNDESPIVARVNGGAQAGHTVVDTDIDGEERRHVFSHVGAGTLAGSSTFLSSRFIANPFVLHQELQQLSALGEGQRSRIEIHPHCQVTTVFDMALNGLRELARGVNRHGSCGMGINETVTRQLAGYPLTIADLTRRDRADKIKQVHDEWALVKLSEINLHLADPEMVSELLQMLDLDRVIATLSEAPNLFGNISATPDKNFSRKDTFIFEGAQGLELDEFLGTFPHVTRSITGLPSALLAAAEVGVTEVTPVYITRAYKTRHGAGPLQHEDQKITKYELTDKTNVTGPWQGHFRYAPLNISQLQRIILADLQRSMDLAKFLRIKIGTATIALTCLDQVKDDVSFYVGSSIRRGDGQALIDSISHNTSFKVKLVSHGPTAKDVEEI